MDIWQLGLLISKFGVYLGVSALLGGGWILCITNTDTDTKFTLPASLQTTVTRHMRLFAVIGIIFSAFDFLFQVGQLAQSGYAGMFDPVMREMVAHSTLGDVAKSRLVLFASALLYLTYLGHSIRKNAFISNRSLGIFIVIALAGFGYTFTLTGHTQQLQPSLKFILAAHAVIALAWVGSLWPLSRTCVELSTPNLHHVMTKFGKSAMYPIGGLIIAGLLLAWQLVRSVSSLLDTNYGFVLLVKLLFVGAIFLIALLHKLRLVPQLLTGITSPRTLQKSIQIELCIGISILMVTVVLSTAVGPNY